MSVQQSGSWEADQAWIVDPVTQVELPVPAFATPEAAIARAAQQRAGGIRTVRFFPDHGHDWPLWDPDAGYTATPDDYELSPDLRAALREWYDQWEAAVGPGDGWSDPEAQRLWEARGDALAEWLAREVWAVADVAAEHRPT